MCICLSLLTTLNARGEHPEEALKSRVELLTDAPLHIGVGALFEGPQRWRLSTSIGWMPSAYVQGANSIVRAFVPTYTEETATLVEDTIQNSLVWRIHGGWRPLKSKGFYTHIGYTFVGLGGGSTARSLLEGITGQSFNDTSMRGERARTESDEPITIDADATLHLFDIEVGWEWRLSSQEAQGGTWTMRAALGWSYTFTSTAELNAEVDETQPRLNAFFNGLESAGEVYLIDTFESYIHPPSLTLALGYEW